MMNDATHSPVTDPGGYAPLLRAIAGTPKSGVRMARGLIFHYFGDAAWTGYTPPRERMAEIDTCMLRDRRDRLLTMDARPLTEPRLPECRLPGCCYDFSKPDSVGTRFLSWAQAGEGACIEAPSFGSGRALGERSHKA